MYHILITNSDPLKPNVSIAAIPTMTICYKVINIYSRNPHTRPSINITAGTNKNSWYNIETMRKSCCSISWITLSIIYKQSIINIQ